MILDKRSGLCQNTAMPHSPVIVNDDINLADNETIIFRVGPSHVLWVAQLVALVVVAFILFFFFQNLDIFGTSLIGIFTLQQWLFLLTLLVLSFVGLVLTLEHFTTFYTATTRRVQRDSGILNRTSFSIPLDEIANLDTRQTLVGRILNYGDIFIRSDSSEINLIRFRNIGDPKARREEIEDHQPHGNVVSVLGENNKVRNPQ